jgi:LDH2 family malate/lactate/ureidoglycolate dehydrogenase
MDEMLKAFRAQEPSPEADGDVMYPGYPDSKYVTKRKEQGVPLPRHTVDYFKKMADTLNVDYSI